MKGSHSAINIGLATVRKTVERHGGWLMVMFQMGGVGPMFGQLCFFHDFAGKDYKDKRPHDRYAAKAKRLLAVVHQRREGHAWIMGDDQSIADIAIFAWIRNLCGFHDGGKLVKFAEFSNGAPVLAAFAARPAVAKGLEISKRG